MRYQTLINAAAVDEQRHHQDWVIVDCRFSLSDPDAGRCAYQESHVPRARYAHLDQDLSDPITPTTGRHPLPDPVRLAQTLGNWGIGPKTQVVAYDESGGLIAARLWWLLRWLGHSAVAVLDGGFAAWQRAGLPVTAHYPTVSPQPFEGQPDDRMWLTTAQVMALPTDQVVLDARTAVRFRGDLEPLDAVAGHIPGALNLPTEGHLTAEGLLLPATALRGRFASVLGDRPPQAVVHSCGSGVTACHGLLAMEIAGLAGSRLYPGSWSEWIRDPGRPVAVGES